MIAQCLVFQTASVVGSTKSNGPDEGSEWMPSDSPTLYVIPCIGSCLGIKYDIGWALHLEISVRAKSTHHFP
jgi:hypothetical protein